MGKATARGSVREMLRAILARSGHVARSLGARRPNYLAPPRTFCSNQAEQAIEITDACVERLKEVVEESGECRLRISVDAGGCSGFQYNFELDDADVTEEDRIFTKDNAEVVVDTISLAFLEGATVDYESSLVRAAFVIQENPNSEAACGCGTSFSPKDAW